MRPLTASDVLQVWERGQRLHPVDRALVLLAAALPGTPWEQLARLPIGRRDSLLISLRTLTFGPRLASYAECPRCGEKLEFEENADTFHPIGNLGLDGEGRDGHTRAQAGTDSEMQTVCETQILEAGDYSIRYRLPDSFDLAAIANSRDPEDARRLLIERCVVEAARQGAAVKNTASAVKNTASAVKDIEDCESEHGRAKPDRLPEHSGGKEHSISEIPSEIAALLAEQIGRANPGADISLDLLCPACGHRWQITFDIVTFFWAEINSLAKRLLREVHTLARAYGWREADILAMSAARRQAYLEMVM